VNFTSFEEMDEQTNSPIFITHLIVVDEGGKAKDFIVQPDQIIDVGSIQFRSK
jgi:hypothetical protein